MNLLDRAARVSPKIRRLAVLTLALAALILAVILGGYWIADHTAVWVYWQIGLVFLLCIDVGYAAAIAGTLALVAVLAFRVVRGGGDPRSRRATARGMLLCGSMAVSVLLAESASALLLRRADRTSAVPVGGAHLLSGSTEAHRLDPLEAIELPTEFPDDPRDGSIVLSIVGESSAEGVPYNRWVSVGRLITWRLEQEMPGKRFFPQIVAFSGHTLEVQCEELQKQKRRPDALIVYCGHNEFSARMDASRDLDYYADALVPSVWETLFERATGWSYFHRLVGRNIVKCRIAIPPPAHGYRAVVDTPVYTEAEYARLLDDFRRRLDAIAAYAERLGALLVLIAPPANDSGFDPNRSFLPAATTQAERRAFAHDLDAAKRLEQADPDAAVAAYRALVDRQPGFAAAHYRLARLLEARGEWNEAYTHDVRARDADGYPMRCLTPFKEAYREAADRHDCIYIDGQAYFHAIGEHGLLDDGLFHDGMHPSLRGQIALAQAVLRGMRARRAFGWRADAPIPTIDPLEAVRRFGLDDPAVWRYLCLWGIMFYDRTTWATFDHAQRSAKRQAFITAADRIEAGASPESVGLRNIGLPEPVPLAPYGNPFSLKPLAAP